MFPLVASVVAAEPLLVRVLEAARPAALTVSGTQLACGTVSLASPAKLSVGADGVRIHGRAETCPLVTSGRETAVEIDGATVLFPQSLSISVEGAVLRLVNALDVEVYLPSVVSEEMGEAPEAALESQAVVSRTFALASRRRHEREGYHLCDQSHCQRYRGAGLDPKAEAAVRKTKGKVLMVGGIALKPALFHAACGGHTSTAQDVFREAGAGVATSDRTKDGPACKDAPQFEWSWQVDRLELARALGAKPDGDAFVPLARDKGGRVLDISTFGKRMGAREFGALVERSFGSVFRGTKVVAQEVEGTVTFQGTGSGHGVGLCQHGARALAQRGFDAKRLLGRYFPDCQVRPLE
jgi:stage II sporulation protein D